MSALNALIFGLTDAEQHREVITGVRALVTRYYENNTDADELDGEYMGALVVVTRDSNITEDALFIAITEAEHTINKDGGIIGSDGRKHYVKTVGVWEAASH